MLRFNVLIGMRGHEGVGVRYFTLAKQAFVEHRIHSIRRSYTDYQQYQAKRSGCNLYVEKDKEMMKTTITLLALCVGAGLYCAPVRADDKNDLNHATAHLNRSLNKASKSANRNLNKGSKSANRDLNRASKSTNRDLNRSSKHVNRQTNNTSKNINHEVNRESKDVNHTAQGDPSDKKHKG